MKLIQSDMYKLQKAFENGWEESSKTMIYKACQWLIGEFSQEQDRDGHPNVESRSCVSVEELIQDFRKAMKEYYVYLREIEPIPITKEFLNKNRFIRVVDKLDGYVTFYGKEIDGNFLEIRFGISNTSDDHVICHVDNSYRCFIGCADIQYIHQLQNFLNVLDIKMKVEL